LACFNNAENFTDGDPVYYGPTLDKLARSVRSERLTDSRTATEYYIHRIDFCK